MAESKKPVQSKPLANEGHTTARIKSKEEVAHRTLDASPAQRSRREYLFGSASVSPVVPSITEPSTLFKIYFLVSNIIIINIMFR